MKKNLFILFVVLLSLSLFLAACGGGSSSGPSDPKALLGGWKADGAEQTFTFFDDGSFALQMGDNAGQGTYTYDGTKLTITSADGSAQTVTASISGDKMTWSVEGSADSTFTKVK